MSRLIAFLILTALPVMAFGYAPAKGWHWYPPELPKQAKKNETMIKVKNLSPSEQLKVVRWYITNAKDNAVLHPSIENNKRFMLWQQFATNMSGRFTKTMEAMLLYNPELDYNLQYSHYNNAAPLTLARERDEQNQAISEFAKSNGLFFFYRGNNPTDTKMAPGIIQFAKTHHIALIGVSVDGKRIDELDQSYSDEGQSRRMGVKAFPALFLVNPQKHKYQPLAYGFISQDDLARQFLNVATHFKAEF